MSPVVIQTEKIIEARVIQPGSTPTRGSRLLARCQIFHRPDGVGKTVLILAFFLAKKGIDSSAWRLGFFLCYTSHSAVKLRVSRTKTTIEHGCRDGDAPVL